MNPMTLTEFLLARIAEDEEAARLCEEMFPTPWEVADRGWRVRIYSSPIPDLGDRAEPGDERVPVVMEVEPDRNLDDPRWLSERVEHVRRHDPTRVQAECEAKRRIIERCRPRYAIVYRESERLLAEAFDQATVRTEGHSGPIWPFDGAEAILRDLALPYADHPDYREEWRP